MQLYTILFKLPYTLVLSSLALAVAAVPVESVELQVLNPSNFKDTIKEGVWCANRPEYLYIAYLVDICVGSLNIFLRTAVTVVGSLRHGSNW